MKRMPWALLLLLTLLVVLPVAEVWLLIEVGSQVGVLPTVAILVLEAALGAWLMRREGARAWRSLEETFRRGRMPTGELADAALILVGGVLLMLPGFVSDLIGLLFLLPLTRPIARHLLSFLVARRLSRREGPADHPSQGTVIPGEVAGEGGPGRPRSAEDSNRFRTDVIRGEVEGDPQSRS